MARNQGLSARELITNIYLLLKQKFGYKEVKLPLEAAVKIRVHPDWHQAIAGYANYETAVLLKVEGKEWAIAFGTAYPIDYYDCDIAAVPILSNGKSDEQLAKEVCEALKDNKCFHNSLIYAMANGQLAVNINSKFGSKALELLRFKIEEFIAHKVETDPLFSAMNLRSTATSVIYYKRELTNLFFNVFEYILAA